MMLVPCVLVLLCIIFFYPSPCESLKCYECSGHTSCGRGQADSTVNCAGQCMVYRNQFDGGTIVRRCYSSDCAEETELRMYEGRNQAFFCSEDLCNGDHSDARLFGERESMDGSPKKAVSLTRAVSSEGLSLSCYDCTGHNPECGIKEATVVHGCQSCMVYLNAFDGNTVIRRCCTSDCGSPGSISEYEGRQAYFCSSNRCNALGIEKVLTGEQVIPPTTPTATIPTSSYSSTSIRTTTITTTSVQTAFKCYECSGPQCGQDDSNLSVNCPTCMVSRNTQDPTIIERRCCWWGCGAPNSVGTFNGVETFFCASDKCNGAGSEYILRPPVTTATSTPTSTASSSTRPTTTTTVQTVFKCYDCSGPQCGQDDSNLSVNCPTCMVSRNTQDPTIIERRCCWWGCGAPNSVGVFNGVETFFCASDKCNGAGSEYILRPLVTTATSTSTSTATSSITRPTTTTTVQMASKCYDCSGSQCGQDDSNLSLNCPTCMVFRNTQNPTIIERRCCWWGCGTPNSLGIYNGVETFFCASDKCNGAGSEYILRPPVTTATSTPTSTASSSITRPTTTTTVQTASKCYDCSGPQCGQDDSNLSLNCPTCMVFRNTQNPTIIERRCCWWGCGPLNSLGIYNGVETFFCASDKCNGAGSEYLLSAPVTTTKSTSISTATTSTTTITTTSTYSSSTCVLNCQNGGIPETEDGCFCYCLDNTSGRECENINCAQSDVDPETCSAENQSLCNESEMFAFECLHLCGKC